MSGDAVLQQTQMTYDLSGNVVLTTNKQRFHDETATGELGTSSTSPKCWVSFSSAYYDPANRQGASAQLGKVSGDSYTVSDSTLSGVPSRSDTVLVTSMAYNSAGWVSAITDPRNVITAKVYDAMGRVTQQVENYDGSTTLPLAASSVTNSANRATNTVFDGLSHTYQLTALMPTGTNSQTTQYNYGVTTSGGSAITSSDLLGYVQYPGRTTGSAGTLAADEQTFTYNILGQQITMVDQNVTTHTYTYDQLGRRISDAVAVYSGNPQGVDTSVLRQAISFDTGGRPYQMTSYNAASGGSIVNQVQMAYNGLGQLTTEYQSHSAAVNTSTSPKVQYAYTEMASGANHSRLTSVTYPNSRVVYSLYTESGGSSGVSNAISRITALATASTRGTSDVNVIASYTYMGLSTTVRKDYPTPKVRLDNWGGTSGTYTGLDSLQRMASIDWVNYNGTAFDAFKINHSYDADSNRLYADNQVQLGSSKAYGYDNLNRLTESDDGNLNSAKTAVAAGSFASKTGYTLDPLGNQTSHSAAEDSSADTATFNSVNELTTRKVKGNVNNSGFSDAFDGTVTPSPWTVVGSGDTYTTGSGLTVTGRTTYNPGDTEEEHRFMVLLPQNSGPFCASMDTTVPDGVTSGQYGYVFGYKSINDYWLNVNDLSDGHNYTYHVTEGFKELEFTDIFADNSFCSDADTWWNIGGQGAFTDGFPSGRVGLFTNVSGMKFNHVSFWPNASKRDLAGRWDNYKSNVSKSGSAGNGINSANSRLTLAADPQPLLLKNLRVQKFQATFSYRVALDGIGDSDEMGFLYDADDDSHSAWLELSHGYGGLGAVDKYGNVATLDPSSNQVTSAGDGDVLWVRITCDGTSVKVNTLVNNTAAPSESDWSSCTDVALFTGLNMTGGRIGFNCGPQENLGDSVTFNSPVIDDLTIKSWNTGTSAFDKTEVVEPFTVDSSGYATNTLSSDANGNQTFDGIQAYTYDAWNRLKTVAHAYRDSGGTLHAGQTSSTMSYDGLGRRITKTVSNTGSWDCTYHYYLDHNSVIEECNGSNLVLKQFVWGRQYIDELIQTSINSDPTNTSHQTCDVNYWACQDANYNVLGIVDSSGVLKERYEYSPYGQRNVFYSPGTNDPYCMAPTTSSQRVVTSGSVTQPYGICEVGHQGLMHDEESELVYNRARYIWPSLGRFGQHDPVEYIVGRNLYEYESGRPNVRLDPSGKCYGLCMDGHFEVQGSAVGFNPICEIVCALAGQTATDLLNTAYHPCKDVEHCCEKGTVFATMPAQDWRPTPQLIDLDTFGCQCSFQTRNSALTFWNTVEKKCCK